MLSYWISFRIHDNATYQKRLKALTDEIDNISTVNWDETTSFHLIETTHDADALARRLKPQIDPDVDLIVFRQIGSKIARYIGKITNINDINKLMPYIKRA